MILSLWSSLGAFRCPFTLIDYSPRSTDARTNKILQASYVITLVHRALRSLYVFIRLSYAHKHAWALHCLWVVDKNGLQRDRLPSW